MRFRNLKSAFVFIALSSMLSGFAHDKSPNTLVITIEGQTVSVYGKSFSTSTLSNFEIKTEASWMLEKNNTSTFQNQQIEEWFYTKTSDHPIEIESNNRRSTSIQLFRNGELVTWLVPKNHFKVDLQQEVNTTNVIQEYLLLGIEHILIGFDHLLFVLGLLFIVRAKSILWTITGFTVAHSITLGLAVSGWLVPISLGLSAIWVEAMIAGSILILALEMRKGTKHSTPRAVTIAFVFGLLHGLGFAGVLQELGLPDSAFWQALISFNIGIELGQLFFIAILILLYQLIKKTVSIEKLSVAMSILVGGLAALWCIERTLLLANLI